MNLLTISYPLQFAKRFILSKAQWFLVKATREDNSLSARAETITELITVMESECQ